MKRKPYSEWSFDIGLYFDVMNMLVFAVVIIISSILSAFLHQTFHLSIHMPEAVYTVILSIAMGGVATDFLYRKVLAPISALSSAMEKVASGDFGVTLTSDSKIKEIQTLYHDFNIMVRELSATETLQMDFVSNVSHEFKTPLAAIEGYAALLRGEPELTPEHREYTERILLNAKRLSGLVSNILLLSKIENQAIPEKSRSFRLDEQIRQAIVVLEPKWAEKDLQLDAEMESFIYVGIESLLFHVWTNLIDNAIKFTPTGGSLQIRMKTSEQNVLVSVKDSGCGISEADKKRIFDKFYQADTSHRNEGNGLGLALVNRIVSAHRGYIEVENCREGGSKFVIVLPLLSE